jgi:Rod binding domain-containing protein
MSGAGDVGAVSAPNGVVRPSPSRASVARQCEGLFLKKLVEELRVSAGGEEGLFGSGPGSAIQEGWFDQIMSDHLAATGKLGFARLIEKGMSHA